MGQAKLAQMGQFYVAVYNRQRAPERQRDRGRDRGGWDHDR